MASAVETKNLYQRLAAISGDVGQIAATGKTAQGTKTLSISDVEDALRTLLAKHGIVTGYRWNEPSVAIAQEGRMTLWNADLTVWLANADDPSQTREDRVYDIGSSPSGAVSFALKRYYRALFHLADEEDETRSTPAGDRRPSTPPAPTPKPAPTATAPAVPPAPAPKPAPQPPQNPEMFARPAEPPVQNGPTPPQPITAPQPTPVANDASADPAFEATSGPCADCGKELPKSIASYITNNRKKGARLRWAHKSTPGGESLCKPE